MLKVKPKKMVKVLEEAATILYPGDNSPLHGKCQGLISSIRVGACYAGNVNSGIVSDQVHAEFRACGYTNVADAWDDIKHLGDQAVVQERRFDILQTLIGYYNSL